MKDVVKAALTTGGAAVLGMFFSAVTGKIISVVAGPSGIGLYAVLLQLYAAAVAFASFGGGGNAVVQGIASRTGPDRDRFIVTSAWIHVAAAVLVALVILAAAPAIPRLLGVESDALDESTVRALAVTMLVGVAVVYLTGLVNGFREIHALARNRILGSVTVAVLAWPAAMLLRGGSQIAMVALVTSGLVVQTLGLLFVIAKKRLFAARRFLHRELFATEPLRHFGAVAGAFFAAGQAAQIGMLLITAAVVRSSGLPGAGMVNVAVTITSGYLMLVLSSFGTYYSPTLAAAPDVPAVQKVMRDVMRVSMMVSVPIIVAVVVLKPALVLLLYTSEFMPSLQVLRWMLIGDYLKILAWVFAIPLSARAILTMFLAGEVGMMVLYYLASLALIPVVGSPEAIGIAFTLAYAVFLLFHVWYARRRWQFVPTTREILVWLSGLTIIVAASVSHWHATNIRYVEAAAWITAATMLSWWGLGAATRGQAIALVRSRLSR